MEDVANRSVTERRWFPAHQPQTLQIGVALLYWNAALSLLFGLLSGGLGRLSLVLMILEVVGGFGIANEKKWGYRVALMAAFVPFLLLALGYLGGGILTLLFEIALVVALLHPQSRSYYKIWFR
ncbi:MAG: hypothetical protein JWO62_1448 [Acidimicrobiaceae bacterium]|jgi:hypothetical protein|nr:hypothetical protein [Acidimicrobiaceae bacterium]